MAYNWKIGMQRSLEAVVRTALALGDRLVGQLVRRMRTMCMSFYTMFRADPGFQVFRAKHCHVAVML
jgi:hypothetical protein